MLESSSSLKSIELAIGKIQTDFAIHVNDDAHALRQIHKRLDDLEDVQETTGQHNVEELKKQIQERDATKAKALDVVLKVIGFIGAIGVGFLARHLFFK
jgi:translation elongation factor EF-1beta